MNILFTIEKLLKFQNFSKSQNVCLVKCNETECTGSVKKWLTGGSSEVLELHGMSL